MGDFIACMDCPDREIGCHSKCEKYQAEVAKHKQLNEMRRRDNLALTRTIVAVSRYKNYKARKDKFIRRG